MKHANITKSIIAALILVSMLFAIAAFSGCEKQPAKVDPEKETTQNAASGSGNESQENPDATNVETQQPSSSEQDTEPVVQEENFDTIIAPGKAEILNIEYLPYEHAMVNGFGAYSEDYEEATILTIGIEFESKRAKDYIGLITVFPDDNTEEKAPTQTYYGTGWNNKPGNYVMAVLRVGGKIDPSKAVLQVKEKYGGSGITTMKFENNGEAIGFEKATAAFSKQARSSDKPLEEVYGVPSSIVKLNGRYYMIHRRYCSVIRSIGNTESYVMVPLSGGLERDMDLASKATLHTDGSVTDVSGFLEINVNKGVDASTIEEQTTIELNHEYIVPAEYDPNDYDRYYDYIDQQRDYINDQLEAYTAVTTVEIEDGDGNTVVLKFG